MTLPVLADPALDAIIAQLRGYVPSLEGRVAGAAEFKNIPETQNFPVPYAFVIPLDGDAERMSQNGGRHRLTDAFGVVVAISNTATERGQTALGGMFGIRRELWRALVGFRPSADYNGIYYEGHTLLALDRSRAWWQFEFAAYHEIGDEDTWQYIEQHGIAGDPAQTGFPPLQTVHFNVDEIEPAANPAPGPDGRIEFQFEANPPQ